MAGPRVTYREDRRAARVAPQSDASHVVPVWEFATRCRDAIGKPEGSLTARLSESLASVAKLHVPASAFRLELVPDYHNMRFEVLDEGERCSRVARFAALKAQFVAQSRGAFAAISKGLVERERITKWDLGTLPEQIEIDYAKGVLPGYPALVAEAGTVALRVSTIASGPKPRTGVGSFSLSTSSQRRC